MSQFCSLGGPRSGCWQIWVLMRASWLVAGRLLTVCSPGCSLCVETDRDDRPIDWFLSSFSYMDINPTTGVPSWPHLNLSAFQRPHPRTPPHWCEGFNIWIWGGSTTLAHNTDHLSKPLVATMSHCGYKFLAVAQCRLSRYEMVPPVFCPWRAILPSLLPCLRGLQRCRWPLSGGTSLLRRPLGKPGSWPPALCQVQGWGLHKGSQPLWGPAHGREKQGQCLWSSGGPECPISRCPIMWAHNSFLVWGYFDFWCAPQGHWNTMHRSACKGVPGNSAPAIKTGEEKPWISITPKQGTIENVRGTDMTLHNVNAWHTPHKCICGESHSEKSSPSRNGGGSGGQLKVNGWTKIP